MEYKSGCLFCGKELLYLKEPEELSCLFCKRVFSTQAKCVDNHFVCDACHALSANDLIELIHHRQLFYRSCRYGIDAYEEPELKNAWA
jgi:Zn finger protein HypA/HybF involved in hydrogenase expression